MPIQKSRLEEKWFYRVLKVVYFILPFVVVAVYYFQKHLHISNLTGNDIMYLAIGLASYFVVSQILWRVILYVVFGGMEDDTVKKSAEVTPPAGSDTQQVSTQPNQSGAQAAVVLFIVIVVLFALWQMGYLSLPKFDIFETHEYGTPCATSNGKKGLYGTDGLCYTCSGSTAVTSPIHDHCSDGIAGIYCCSRTDGDDGDDVIDGCVPTGCGSLWYCSGSYYVEGVRIDVTGGCFPYGYRPSDLFSGWSGTCRQCP